VTAKTSDSPGRGRDLLSIVLVFIVALAVRLIYFAEVRDTPLYQFPTLDERGNHEFALAVLQGHVPAVSYYKAPLYTYFLASVYRVLGDASIRARLVQCILAALSPVLTLLIARQLFGRAVGLVAGLWAAVFWTFVFFSVELLDASLACFFYLTLAYLLVAWDDRKPVKWLVCGLVLGLGAITRPNVLAFAPVLAVVVFVIAWRRERRDTAPSTDGGRTFSPGMLRRPLLSVLALTLGCCAAVLPVTVRNRIVGGEWVLLGAYGGLNVYVANNPHSDSKDGPLLVDESGFLPDTTWDPNEPWARCCLNFKNAYRFTEAHLGRKPRRGEFSSLLAGMGFEYIGDNPGWFARHAIRRFCWLFNAHESPSNKDLYHVLGFSRLLQALSWFHYGWLAPLGLVGLGLALASTSNRSAGLTYLVAMLASLALPAVMFIINSRFRLPMVHVLVVFAAFGLVELVRMVRRKADRSRLIVVALLLAALVLLCNLNLFGYRKDHHPYLRFAYAVACLQSGRHDLLDGALADFDRDLKADLIELQRQGRRSNTTLLLDHCNPMRLLLPYYLEHGQQAEALRAAERMLEREHVDGEWAPRLFGIFLAADKRELAGRALQLVERECLRARPDVVADALARFGRKWNDRRALDQARGIYQDLTRRHPGRFEFYKALEGLREASTIPATAPTTPPASDGRR